MGDLGFPRSKKSCVHMQYFELRNAGVKLVTAIAWRVLDMHTCSHSACGYSKLYVQTVEKIFISGQGCQGEF